jgi:addiction module HigA family antidote
MHNPPHPGEVLREYLGDITVTEAAVKLGVNRVTLSRVVTGSSGVSPDMAYRLGEAFGTSPELWAGMQLQYDLYQAGKVKRPKIERIAA